MMAGWNLLHISSMNIFTGFIFKAIGFESFASIWIKVLALLSWKIQSMSDAVTVTLFNYPFSSPFFPVFSSFSSPPNLVLFIKTAGLSCLAFLLFSSISFSIFDSPCVSWSSSARSLSPKMSISRFGIPQLWFNLIYSISNFCDITDVWHGKISSLSSLFHGMNCSISIWGGRKKLCSKKLRTLIDWLENISPKALSIILERHNSGKPFSISTMTSKLLGLCCSIASFKAVLSSGSGFNICRARVLSVWSNFLISCSLMKMLAIASMISSF